MFDEIFTKNCEKNMKKCAKNVQKCGIFVNVNLNKHQNCTEVQRKRFVLLPPRYIHPGPRVAYKVAQKNLHLEI